MLRTSILTALLVTACSEPAPPVVSEYPILFVTQVPWDGFATISMPFGNQSGDIGSIPRGGDLWIRYPDGTLRNLTEEAGFGSPGMQGDNAIAVREPTVHWDGTRAVFAMVVGAPEQYEYDSMFWQLYEVTGFGPGQAPSITKVSNQPPYNNVSPCYGSDDRILFTSDRPRGGEAHLYPQLDEYESTETVTGIWSLDPTSGELFLVEHAPSGAFNPFVDSAGRVVFTKWDHLQRDQQADTPEAAATYDPIDFANESLAAATTRTLVEVYPESRTETLATPYGPLLPHRFNQFIPWEVRQDGTGEETLNHVGRQELGGSYTEGSFADDDNLSYYTPEAYHANRNYVGGDGGFFYLREDVNDDGRFVGVAMREFAGGRSGQLIELRGGVGDNPEDMLVTYLTPESTRNDYDDGGAPGDHSGHYRNPLVLSDGTLLAAHTSDDRSDEQTGSRSRPDYLYSFRIRSMRSDGEFYVPDGMLTQGISKTVSWYDPDELATYDGELWELDPVEVRPRPRPQMPSYTLETPEASAFTDEAVTEDELRTWLAERDLALIVSRNVTVRDRGDMQQPYFLRVPTGVTSAGATGTIYDVSHMQIVQGDQVRGYGDLADPDRGRRVLSRPLHDDGGANPVLGSGPPGSVTIGTDGSMAAFVPARRALSWQLVDPTGVPIVRERNWVSFQPGEIRVCAACHGLNTQGHAGEGVPTNQPAALRALLQHWKTIR